MLQELVRVCQKNSRSSTLLQVHWEAVISLLLRLRELSPSPIVQEMAQDIITHGFTRIILKHRSISLLQLLGGVTAKKTAWFWDSAFQLFNLLDEIMTDFCNNPNTLNNEISVTTLQSWCEYRSEVIGESRDRRRTVAHSTECLHDLHFNQVHPCSTLDVLTSFSSPRSQ